MSHQITAEEFFLGITVVISEDLKEPWASRRALCVNIKGPDDDRLIYLHFTRGGCLGESEIYDVPMVMANYNFE